MLRIIIILQIDNSSFQHYLKKSAFSLILYVLIFFIF